MFYLSNVHRYLVSRLYLPSIQVKTDQIPQ